MNHKVAAGDFKAMFKLSFVVFLSCPQQMSGCFVTDHDLLLPQPSQFIFLNHPTICISKLHNRNCIYKLVQ